MAAARAGVARALLRGGGAWRARARRTHPGVLADLLDDGGRLQRELARGDEDERLDRVPLGVGLLKTGDDERGRLAGPVFGPRQNVAILQNDGDGLLLDRRRAFEALLKDPHEQLALQEVVLEVLPLGLGHVLRGGRGRGGREPRCGRKPKHGATRESEGVRAPLR